MSAMVTKCDTQTYMHIILVHDPLDFLFPPLLKFQLCKTIVNTDIRNVIIIMMTRQLVNGSYNHNLAIKKCIGNYSPEELNFFYHPPPEENPVSIPASILHTCMYGLHSVIFIVIVQ